MTSLTSFLEEIGLEGEALADVRSVLADRTLEAEFENFLAE